MPPRYVPGLERPVSISEYATLTGATKAAVIVSIRTLKIPAEYADGQWWVEAPRNSEVLLAELRRGQQPQPNDSEQKIAGNAPPLPFKAR
jgi:hypothetical protein